MAHGWFMDDGQIFCAPEHLDTVLKRVDEGFSAIGARRGNRTLGEVVKRTVRVFNGGGAGRPPEGARKYDEYDSNWRPLRPKKRPRGRLGTDFGQLFTREELG